ncbi:hypothetical protein [Bradyrhizobium sp. STM 3561]|uniref:hypothetical protein n=1 Tax=Bradyrhizobium sp. STM 3561 TaxID=578923 RepID=UPI00388E6898
MSCRISSASMFALAMSLLLIQATQASPVDVAKKWGILGRWGIGECDVEKGRGRVIIYEEKRTANSSIGETMIQTTSTSWSKRTLTIGSALSYRSILPS